MSLGSKQVLSYSLLETITRVSELRGQGGCCLPPSQFLGNIDEKKGRSDFSKCFTYVTKTIANLATYSRKPGNYNGTIIFEIDIMKNSSPLNLKFTFFSNAQTQTKIKLLFCLTHSTLSSASEPVNQNKRNKQNL